MIDGSAGKNAVYPADDVAMRPSFFDTLRIQHGTHALLGRFFLAADTIVNSLGIRLVRSSLAELADLQNSNIVSWPLFAPMLDPRLGGIDPNMSYGFLGVDRAGRIACAQGGRVYSSGAKSLRQMIDDQSFFYGDGRRPQLGQPTCWTTSPATHSIRGLFTYSGALWVHPEHRGHRLAAVLPRISRAYALARWNSAYTIAVVSDQIAASPLMAMYGYKTIEPMFGITNVGPKDYRGVFMSMTQQDLQDDLALFLAGKLAQVDAAIRDRSAENDTPPAIIVNR